MQNIKIGDLAGSVAISKRSNHMKKLFLFSFIVVLIAFLAIFLFYQSALQRYLLGFLLHAGLFFSSMFFIYQDSWHKTFIKLGIQGNLKEHIKYFLLGIAMIALVTIALNIFLHLFQIKDGQNVINVVKKLPLYILLFAIFIAPITEELFFRAFLVEKVGIIVSSLLFALSHVAYGSLAEIIGVFFVGIVLAYIYKKSKSIIPVIAIHFITNLSSILLIKTYTG